MEFKLRTLIRGAAAGLIAWGTVLAAMPVSAEVKDIKIARQYSIGHLPLMVMKDQQLLEKRLKARGLSDVTVTWVNLAGSAAMIDGLLSGSLQVASTGTSGFAVLWDKTKGDVKAIAAQTTLPVFLVTRDPNVKSPNDLTEKNRIAVPAVGVSPQAIFLKMQAMQLYGKEGVGHFDKMTVTMSHPDAFAAMLSGAGGIDTHFAAPPYDRWEVERIPGARVILNSDDLTGGPATATVLMASEKFRKESPEAYAAVSAALRDAIDLINKNPRLAAEILLKELNNKKDSVEDTVKIMNGPGMSFSYTPKNIVKLFNAMYDIGVLKRKPTDWKELFFPDAHTLDGN
jgi:NitT/TauT family transport system substrate-binding protein